MNRGYQTAARKYREMSSDQESTQARATSPSASATPPAGGMPDLSSLLGSLGGAGRGGGGGGSGGGPDLGGLLNNPMLMNMAQQMASSGAFNDIMNNPRMRDMAQQMMSGERNIGDIMNDPEVQNMYSPDTAEY
jgi:small glutamine-rich tetratricopeptide repeat-containing protein alpha